MKHILALMAAGFILFAHVTESRSQSIIFRGDSNAAVEHSYKQAREQRAIKAEQRAAKQEAKEQKALDREYQRQVKEINKAYYKRVADHKKRLSGKKN